ncbi:MAG: M48 family metallopeptidase [Terriglobia bacterium]
MNGGLRRRPHVRLPASMALAAFFLALSAAWGVDTPGFKPGFNLFSPQQDVQLGKERAEEVDRTYPLLADPQVLRYVNDLGRQLASLAPSNSPAYVWTFKVINSSDINAFALPGGYIYLDRGAIEAAENEAQLAGVMAHESGHVVMRHGTHEASEALLAQAPLALLESMLGRSGSLTGQLTALGLDLGVNSILLKNSRDAEIQADAVGTYILYRAGYDPHALAEFFEIVEKKYPRRTVQFFSDHPNPEDRAKRIAAEASGDSFVYGPTGRRKSDSTEFEDAKKRLLSLGAPSSAETAPSLAANSATPPPPSGRLIKFDGYGISIAYPDNWRVQRNEDAVVLVPPGGIVELPETGAAQAFGISISRFQPQGSRQGSWGLVDATEELLNLLRASNPNLKVIEQRSMNLKGRSALSTLLETDSPLPGQKERDLLVTARQSNFMLSLICIAPQSQFDAYKTTFDEMLESLELR